MKSLPLSIASLLITTIISHTDEPAGTIFDLGGKKGRIVSITQLPYVTNEYSKRFTFDRADNPKLKELREKYRLDEVVAGGKDEFDKQVLLMDWAHRRFKKFGKPSTNARGALEILGGIDQGNSFFCAQYAQLMISAAASMGWVDRSLALRRHKDLVPGRSTEHSTTEIWSNQYGKWVMLDPTSNMYLEKGGVPLNAWEIREEWFNNDGNELVFVIGKNRSKYRKSDLPIYLERFAGFGDLTVDPDELDKYGFIGYIPNTNLMEAGEDYGQMFIVKDKLCEGTQWHKRDLPARPATEPYFPIQQANMSFEPRNGGLVATLRTLTPNFETFQTRVDGGNWKETGNQFEWKLHPGTNRIEARTVNLFGVIGPVSKAEVELQD